MTLHSTLNIQHSTFPSRSVSLWLSLHRLHDHDRTIILPFSPPSFHASEDFATDLGCGTAAMLFHHPQQPVDAELAIVPVVRFDDAVGVETKQIARIELREYTRVRRVGRRAEHRTAVRQLIAS